MEHEYSDCFYCGGRVIARCARREVRWKDRLLVFENVPMGICAQCGERVITPEVAKSLDRLLAGGKKPTKTIRVPVYEFTSSAA
jgi:YgiT-type zinc finger domain-containing protein